ncbi:MAG TPA: ParB/RepB/Spo0J family partition protein [Pyrinomonadaceae bacterium]|nr:ParB/RepB/Spo0J family partition protein [Pyrinomonadaceae bacterium]
MPKSGLPLGVKMRHDAHYVDQIASRSRSVGRTIAITLIFPNPEQPRSEFGDLSELTESIKEKGVLEPLLVRPTSEGRFMIIAGERRWRASKLAGLIELPCIELDIDDNAVAEIALIENLQRKDLTVWEEADGLRALGEKFGYTHDQIAQKISKSRTTVTELLTIANLPDEIRSRCRDQNILSKAVLLEIARQFDEEAMFHRLDALKSAEVVNRGKQRSYPDRSRQTSKESEGSSAPGVFNYRSPEKDFDLSIHFRSEEFDKGHVLRALKRAFDDTKSGQ